METIGFDFRGQHPQKLLVKMVQSLFPPRDESLKERGKRFLHTAWDMSMDLFKTFAPIKQSPATLVQAVLELTALVLDEDMARIKQNGGHSSHSGRSSVNETLLDLLDLFTQFPKMTKVGSRLDLDKLMDIKIDINKQISKDSRHRYHEWCGTCEKDLADSNPVTPGSATSPATNNSFSGSGSVKRKGNASDGTLRFVFDADEARRERELVAEYTNDEYEEYEVEVEETIREPEHRHPPSNVRGSHPHRNHGHNHNDHGWGPYSRGRHGHYNDRSKGRKAHGYYQ